MTQQLIRFEGIIKKFKSGFELKVPHLEINPGETIAFLGKNGAGKSTLFQLLTANSEPSKGKIYLQGERLTIDNFQIKRKFGYLPQSLHLPKWINCSDVLKYASNLYEIKNASTVIESSMKYWDCEFYQKKPLASCSHGMQKRVGLALATIHDPICLILDEPFSGLDIYHTKALENEISRRKDLGKTTIISTHITPYVANLCDKVYLVDQGNISSIENWNNLNYEEKITAIEHHFFTKESHL